MTLALYARSPMRSIIFAASISLDGYIEGPNGEKDWVVADEEGGFDSEAFLSDFDTIFFGRKVYEEIAIPPLLPNAEEREFFYALYGIRKFVFTRREAHVRGNGMVVRGNIRDEVDRIRGEDGKNILFCGGAGIFTRFAELGLIDEYVLTVYPVILGAGEMLFKDNKKPLDLKLINTRLHGSGVVTLHYKTAERINKVNNDGGSI